MGHKVTGTEELRADKAAAEHDAIQRLITDLADLEAHHHNESVAAQAQARTMPPTAWRDDVRYNAHHNAGAAIAYAGAARLVRIALGIPDYTTHHPAPAPPAGT